MTPDESHKLKPGTRVCFNGDPADCGAANMRIGVKDASASRLEAAAGAQQGEEVRAVEFGIGHPRPG